MIFNFYLLKQYYIKKNIYKFYDNYNKDQTFIIYKLL